MGTMLGYATVTIMTDSGVGLMEETVGVSAGASGASSRHQGQRDDSTTDKVRKGIFRSLFAF